MKYLKYALVFFCVVDLMMFVVYQISPNALEGFLPQFAIESQGNSYPRLVGVLFLMLGLTRLYGALYMNEKGAVQLSMWSWIVELVYISTEIFHGQFIFAENLMAYVLAPLMFIWTLKYYNNTFK